MNLAPYTECLCKCSKCLQEAMDALKDQQELHPIAIEYLDRIELLKTLIDTALKIEERMIQDIEKRKDSL